MSKSNELPSKRQEEIAMPETKAKPSNFTQISNEVLLDERLSFKARGILALLLSRPKDWQIYIDEIVERSEADGKHSVRTGFKELKEFGYLKLVKVWNDSGQFEGTVYQLCLKKMPKSKKTKPKAAQKNLAAPTDFPKDEETDLPKIATNENPSDETSERAKTVTPSNTEHSNTKIQQQQQQQQQTRVDDDVFLKNENVAAASAAFCENKANIPVAAASAAVCESTAAAKAIVTEKTTAVKTAVTNQTATDFLPCLQNDDVWKKQFVGKNICIQVGTTEILTVAMFDLLLNHFTQTSIASGATYADITAIKRHFFNWFNANLNKNALPNYIEQQTELPKKVRKQVAVLIPKTDAIVNKIHTQQYDGEPHLYRCLQLLETHLAIYENAVNILDDVNKQAVNTWILDIQKTKNLVERGRKAGQLQWFSSTSKLQLGNKTKPTAPINLAIANLSQQFAAA
jgi:cytidine deaminase